MKRSRPSVSTAWDKFPSEMSGGMQKRAALARALVRRPKILMLDEPTTGLDPSRTGAIHELIRRTQENFHVTAVMVSHDVPAVFEVSDGVAFLHNGRTHLNGTVAEVMAATTRSSSGFWPAKRPARRTEQPLRAESDRLCTQLEPRSLSSGFSRFSELPRWRFCRYRSARSPCFPRRGTPSTQASIIFGLEDRRPGSTRRCPDREVTHIGLKDMRARVALRVDQDVEIDSEAIAAIKTSGIIGDKYVSIALGPSSRILKNGDTISPDGVGIRPRGRDRPADQ